ncbi:MAG: cyanophycinase, partial [Verrucomicrobiae bacterium]|nr:cyanophycinase [Verrucomicrobiae bacterium]
MPARSKRLVTASALAALLANAAAGPATKPATGKLVIAGGAITTSKKEIWDVIMAERLNGRPIGIISAASAKPAESGRPLAKSLGEEYGANAAVFIPLDSKLGNARDPEILALIERCGGFFFTGGNQSRITSALLNTDGSPTPALLAIRQIHRTGGVIGGTSAGAAIMSDRMITG